MWTACASTARRARARGATGGLGGQGSQVGGRLNDINPDDIESIEVISGPAAATIYGPRRRAASSRSSPRRGARRQPRECRSQAKADRCSSATPPDRMPTNYAKDRTGAIVTWNGVQQEADRGRRSSGPGSRGGTTGRRPAGATRSLLYVRGVRERLRHRAEQLDAAVLGAREPQHALGPKTDFVDEPQLRRSSPSTSARTVARRRCSAHSSAIRCCSRQSRGFYPNFPPEVPQTAVRQRRWASIGSPAA